MTIALENNYQTKTEYDYDAFANVTEVREYDWADSTPGSLLRKTHRTYGKNGNPDYTNRNIVRKATDEVVYDGVGNRVAETSLTIDNNGTAYANGPAGAPNHDLGYDSSVVIRGHVTAASRWLNTINSFLPATNYTYNALGNIISVSDPGGRSTDYSYDDRLANTACPPPLNSQAYVTQVTHRETGLRTQLTYFPCTGQIQGRADENDLRNSTPPRPGTTYTYDAMNRTLTVSVADGGLTTNSYTDSVPPIISQTRRIDGATSLRMRPNSTAWAGWCSTELTSDPDGTDYVDTTYDLLGRVHCVSNPHRSGSLPSDGNTCTDYDVLNRVITVTHPGDSQTITNYSGRATKVTDESNGTYQVSRISQSDGLGRLRYVCEVSGTTQAGSSNNVPMSCGLDVPGSGFLTSYDYDTLGDVTRVAQAGLKDRTFTYDSLSRLVCAANPELQTSSQNISCPNPDTGSYTAGTIRYAYDVDGNLISKISPKPNQTDSSTTVTATYGYNSLHQRTSTAYNDGVTPGVAYDYSQTSVSGVSPQNPWGRLTREAVANGTATQIFSYDEVGRIKDQWQCTPFNCGTGRYQLSYGYDNLGNVVSATNGVGVTITSPYSSANRLLQVTSSLSDASHPGTLFSSPSYGPVGLTQASLGNGLVETRTYQQRAWLQSLQVNDPAGGQGLGWVTVSGTLQPYSQPATAGTGSVTISGAEQSEQVWIPNLVCAEYSHGRCVDWEDYGYWTTVYDTGTVSVTVNGFQKSVGYDYSSSANSVAAALASAFNGDGGSPVTASANGTVVNLTAKTTGSSTNYSVSTSSGTTLPAYFSSSSFFASGSNLVGGHDAIPGYDSGTTTITLNGTPYSYAWSGSGTTASSIAANLASSIHNNSSLVDASASGSTVNLWTRQSGQGTNYSLSASSNSTMSSFSTGTSGGTLTVTLAYSFAVTFAPDGNIISANDLVNGNWAYTYDDLNRLKTAIGGAGYGCAEVYDRYGNRWQQNVQGGSCLTPQFTFTGGNNRIDTYSYDAAGNLLNDGSHSYVYDAENRIVCADPNTAHTCANGAAATYVYDAEGRRVQRTSPAGTVYYLYDPAGRAVTEINSTGGWNRGEVYADGRHLATYMNATTYFVHTDWLGNERRRTKVDRTQYSSWTSLPFGEGSSTPDPSPLHSTGKERDSETGLDYFGARHYASTMGRFMTPDLDDLSDDPGPAPYADFRDPQTLNLYSYVRNNPLNRIDPDGHKLVCTNSSSSNAKGNITVTVNCHEEPDQSPPQPSVIDQIRMFFSSDVSDPADKRAIIGSIVRGVVTGGNSGNLNSLLPNVATNSNTPGPPTVPLKALKLLDAIDAASSPTIQGGKNFKNDGRGGGQVLPPTDGQGNAITYRERYVNATPAGARRDAERIVTGSDGSAYYTADHYQTFTKIR